MMLAIPLFSRAVDAATDSYRKRDFTGSLATCYIEMGETGKAVAEYLKTIKSASTGRTSLWTTMLTVRRRDSTKENGRYKVLWILSAAQ